VKFFSRNRPNHFIFIASKPFTQKSEWPHWTDASKEIACQKI